MDNQPGVTAQRRRAPAEIEQIAAAFACSGLTRTEFCRREHLGLGTLNRYLQRQYQDVDSGAAGGRLVPIEVADSKVATHQPNYGLAVVLARGTQDRGGSRIRRSHAGAARPATGEHVSRVRLRPRDTKLSRSRRSLELRVDIVAVLSTRIEGRPCTFQFEKQ